MNAVSMYSSYSYHISPRYCDIYRHRSFTYVKVSTLHFKNLQMSFCVLKQNVLKVSKLQVVVVQQMTHV